MPTVAFAVTDETLDKKLILLTGSARRSDVAKHACTTKSLRSAILDDMLYSKSLPCETQPAGTQCCRVQSCYLHTAGAVEGDWSG